MSFCIDLIRFLMTIMCEFFFFWACIHFCHSTYLAQWYIHFWQFTSIEFTLHCVCANDKTNTHAAANLTQTFQSHTMNTFDASQQMRLMLYYLIWTEIHIESHRRTKIGKNYEFHSKIKGRKHFYGLSLNRYFLMCICIIQKIFKLFLIYIHMTKIYRKKIFVCNGTEVHW